MVALPDPKIDNIQVGFKWFRSNVPRICSVVDTAICIGERHDDVWILTCQFIPSFDVYEVKRAMQKSLGAVCRVLTVKQIVTAHGRKWTIEIAPQNKHRVNWRKRIPCLTFTNTKAKDMKKDQQPNPSKLNLTKIKTKECQIIGSDDMTYSIDSQCTPKKLIYGGRNITAKVFGKSRLNNHFKRVLEKGLTKPLIWVKNHRDVKFIKQMDKSSTHVATPSPSVVPPRKISIGLLRTPVQTKVETPYDYKPLEQRYRLSKLRDRAIFKCAEEFVALKQFLPEEKRLTCMRAACPRLELMNVLLANNLPVDETLSKLFLEYCIETGISNVEVENGFSQVRQRYGAH